MIVVDGDVNGSSEISREIGDVGGILKDLGLSTIGSAKLSGLGETGVSI
jgi:hypothetical protein